MRIPTLFAVALMALSFTQSANALEPFARAYVVDGWSYAGRAGGTGGKAIRRYVGLNRKGVSVALTGFKAKPMARDCYGKHPSRCYGESNIYREVQETSAYIRDQKYDSRTGWVTFTVVVVQNGRTYGFNPSFYWQLGYVVNALESR
ncbi:MAG: hypothetical protein AAGH19_10595 [Pseudomonadota bacterium]